MHLTNYRADIDSLRAVAVTMVLMLPLGLGVPGGYVGLDVFFVISGFLIAGIIKRELGPVHTIFPRCVADQKGHAQGAKRSRGRPPARLRNAAHGIFGRNPKGMG